jgi:hypothetical protein
MEILLTLCGRKVMALQGGGLGLMPPIKSLELFDALVSVIVQDL